MLVIKQKYRDKNVIIHLRKKSGGVMRIDLKNADNAALKALADAGHDAVESKPAKDK